jgi:hypothetical protein
MSRRAARRVSLCFSSAHWLLLSVRSPASPRHPADFIPQVVCFSTFGLQLKLAALGSGNLPDSPEATNPSASIPLGVFVVAPHLASLSSKLEDEHLQKTFTLRQAYSVKRVTDNLIDVMQQQFLDAPLPRSIWRKIIQDQFVPFDKLLGAMDRGYDYQVDSRDFYGGFALVRKDKLVARKPVTTEADWIRVFGAWEAGVLLIYPHRAVELQGYKRLVREMFRATPTEPLTAIRFDSEVRGRYLRNPFHLDDRLRVNTVFLGSDFLYFFEVAGSPPPNPCGYL